VAKGYVLKTNAGSELWPAIEAVLQNKRYLVGVSGAAFRNDQLGTRRSTALKLHRVNVSPYS